MPKMVLERPTWEHKHVQRHVAIHPKLKRLHLKCKMLVGIWFRQQTNIKRLPVRETRRECRMLPER